MPQLPDWPRQSWLNGCLMTWNKEHIDMFPDEPEYHEPAQYLNQSVLTHIH